MQVYLRSEYKVFTFHFDFFSHNCGKVPTNLLSLFHACIKQNLGLDKESFMLIDSGRIIQTSDALSCALDRNALDEVIHITVARHFLAAKRENFVHTHALLSSSSQLTTLMEWLNFQVKYQCNSIACRDTDFPNGLTYQWLNIHANQLAHYLAKDYGIESGARVGIMGRNGALTVISMLAVLKLGAAFVIIDPHAPQGKMNGVLEQAQADCLILCHLPAEGVTIRFASERILNIEEQREEINTQSRKDPENGQIQDSQLAYLLFTSGSTSSNPKTVKQTRKGLLGQMQNYAQDLNLTSKDKLLQISHIGHDQALCNIFGALLTGATLVFYDLSMPDPKKIREEVRANEITLFTSIPSVFSFVFADMDPNEFPSSLRLIRLGGEAVTDEQLKLFCRVAKENCLLGIGYGATECSWIAYHSLTKHEIERAIEKKEMPLGKMSSHITPWIEIEEEGDKKMGELCVSSPYLSLGYLENEEAQKAAFFDLHGQRYYRTGDYVEVKEDQTYLFKGRKNGHVKIDGVRVNLKEIEDCFKQHLSLVEECVILPHGEEQHVKLYAFYTVKKGGGFAQNNQKIKEYLSQNVRSFEIPVDYFRLDSLPRLPNQKMDRVRLMGILEDKIKEKQAGPDPSILHLVDQTLNQVLDCSFDPFEGYEKLTFKELGMSSLELARFYQILSVKLSLQQRGNISLVDLYSARNIESFKALIDGKNQEEASKAQEPKLHTGRIQLGSDIYVNYKEYGVHSLLFDDSAILCSFYNNKYGIKIVPCQNLKCFHKAVKNFLTVESLKQIGLFVPLVHEGNVKDGHRTPFILHKEEDKLFVYIGDCIGVCPQKEILDVLVSDEIKNLAKGGIFFYIDPVPRLGGMDYGCGAETLYWLLSGLRLKDKFRTSIRLLDSEGFSHIPKEYRGCPIQLFLSMPDQLATSCVINFPADIPLKLDVNQVELGYSGSKNRKTLAQHLKKYEKTGRFELVYGSDEAEKQRDFTYNDFLRQKSLKFNLLAERLKRT